MSKRSERLRRKLDIGMLRLLQLRNRSEARFSFWPILARAASSAVRTRFSRFPHASPCACDPRRDRNGSRLRQQRHCGTRLSRTPFRKRVSAEAGFRYSGHTDYLGHLAGGLPTVMMLATKGLKVVPATVHVGLRQAIESLTADLLIACGRIAAQALPDDFSISSPRLVMTGLNPHAGEGGLFGFEEQLIIAPAVEQLQAEGIDVRGPCRCRQPFSCRCPRGLRRCDLHVPRPGADPDQNTRL